MQSGFLCFVEEEGFDVADSDPKRKPKITPSEKELNIALWKITKGKGSIIKALCTITGMTEDAVKGRIKRVEWEYAPEDIEPQDQLDAADYRYLARHFGNTDNPEIREWLTTINAPIRSRPDWRRSSDRVGPVGKSKRIRQSKSDG